MTFGASCQCRVCLFAALVFTLLVAGCAKQHAQTRGAPPPVPVSAAKAERQAVPFEIRVVGNVLAHRTVSVKSRIAGELEKVHFTEGQDVREGQLLFEIDSQPYRDALRQAEAAVARDRARLAQSEAQLARDQAQLKFAEADAGRYLELSRAGVISKSQYDQVRTGADVNREAARASGAAIEEARASLEADVAAVDRAKLDLSYCRIVSPVSGRAGNLLVHAGNLVRAAGDDLVTIHEVSPIFVTFGVAERHLDAIRRANARRPVAVRAYAQDSPADAEKGTLAVIDNAVDTNTGTIRLKGVFDNARRRLWPGQFVNVVVTLDTLADAVTVPTEAVQPGQNGEMVYVVKNDRTVEPRPVTAGRAFGRGTVIEKGVEAGETVITDGHLRLFPGAQVQIVDAAKLDAAAAGSGRTQAVQ